jgi:hypothetical protein
MNDIQRFTANNITIDYLRFDNNYIICFLDNLSENVLSYIETLFNVIYPDYYKKGLYSYTNFCGKNSENICNELKKKNDNIKTGKIIIHKWSNYTKEDYDTIKDIFGYINEQIKSSYHALVYIEIIIDNIKYYIAIETTTDKPFKLQFLVGDSRKALDLLLSARYLCDKYNITYDCDIAWWDTLLTKGGKKKKLTKKQYRKRNNNNNNKKYRNKTKKYRNL